MRSAQNLLLIIVMALAIVACDNPTQGDPSGDTGLPGDGTGEDPGIVLADSAREITVTATGTSTVTISFSAASHDTAGEVLTYSLYASTADDIATQTEMESNGSLEASGAAGELDETTSTTSISVTITGLDPLQRYYLNVCVNDTLGNAAVYRTVEAATTSASPDVDATLIVGAGESGVALLDASSQNQLSFQVRVADKKELFAVHYNSSEITGHDAPVTELPSRIVPGGAVGSPLSGSEAVTESNQHLANLVLQMPQSPAPLRNLVPGPRMESESVGSTTAFWVDQSGWVEKPATLRSVTTADGVTLKVWVADDAWVSGGTRTNLVTGPMVSELASRFLTDGAANDIYDLVTNVYGPPWGTHSYGNLIPATNTVDILLLDIGNDNSTSGGVVGYFWSKDNFVPTSDGTTTDKSNERVMFYVDSVLFATPEGSWDTEDYWPRSIFSTLVHEFQHMIHFYQRGVVRNLPSEVWYNEMLSMATEDLVADALGLPGPRGVITSDGSAGSPGITSGRLPYFNVYPETPFRTWLPSTLDSNNIPYVMRSYSLWYAMGAYVLRAFGGAEVLQALMVDGRATDDGDEWELAWALRGPYGYQGYDELFTGLMASALLSNRTNVEPQFAMNNGGWFESSLNGITYRVGSVNFYNYSMWEITGPFTYTSSELASLGTIAADSAYIEGLGTVDAGLVDVTIDTGSRSYPDTALVVRDDE